MSFVDELKRRNVIRVAIAYVAVAWLLIQVVETLFPIFDIAVSAVRVVVIVLAIGFIPTLIFAWVFELTPEGLMREKDVDRAQSTTDTTGRKLDRAIIVIMALALSYFAFDKFILDPARDRELAAATTVQALSGMRMDLLGASSVAVMPFENISGDPEDETFTTGIHNDLITQISKIGSIKTISRVSISQYRNTEKRMDQIARELGVATILNGGVQRAGDQVRISVQLIDAASEASLWAETYDRKLTVANILAIQSGIATSVARELKQVLSSQELDRLNYVPTENLEAYDAFLTGNEFLARPASRQNVSTAKQMFVRATSLDPDFAEAWANLSLCHSTQYWFVVDRTESSLKLALQALNRSRVLKADLPETHIAAGYYFYYGFRDYDSALKEFSKAEKLLPGDARILAAQAYIQRRLGQWGESIASMERAIVLDPRNAGLIEEQAGSLEMIGRHREAGRYYERARIVEPDSAIILFKQAYLTYNASGDTSGLRNFLANNPGTLERIAEFARWFVEFLDGDYGASLAALRTWNNEVFSIQRRYFPRTLLEGLSHQYLGDAGAARPAYESSLDSLKRNAPLPSDEPRIMLAYGMTYAGLGRRDEAVEFTRRALDLVAASSDLMDSPYYEMDAIFVLSMAGADDAAVAQLSAYLDEPSVTTLAALRADPRIARLENHAGFQELIRKSEALLSP